ncbi:hypothetical protein BASA62_007873 [Batrachochytrium salamandrivorans]|nr:hypothetical protein BASA62_007873 [Batrachochytrium salamandrivorans]
MKFNVLAVAAMAIASVNAGGRKKFPGYSEDNDEPAPAMTHDSFDGDSGESKDPESTKKESADDSNVNGAGNPPVCDDLLLKLRDLQEDLFDFSCNFQSDFMSSQGLKGKMDSLKSGKMNDSPELREEVNAKLDDTKNRFADFKAKYTEAWAEFVAAGCSVKSSDSVSPKEIEKVEDALNKQMYFWYSYLLFGV